MNGIVSAGAIAFAINVATSLLKRTIYPKYGKLGVQVFSFAVAALVALYVTVKSQYPDLQVFVESTLGIFSMSVAFYEVVWSHLNWFKAPELDTYR